MPDVPSLRTSFTTTRAYDDVVVVPFTELLLAADREHRGGPIWPDWPEADWAGYWHSSAYGRVDTPPEPPTMSERLVGDHFFWIGAVYRHFGHQIRDFGARILGSVTADPQAVLVFATRAGRPGVPDWFWSIPAWFGVDRERVLVVTRPTRFSTLQVVPQPEWAGVNHLAARPDPAYIEALTRHAEQRLGPVPRSGTTYVSRAGIAPAHNILGEAELDRWFRRNGHRVIHPERLPLTEQLRAYVGAEWLVFSAGSAIHGLQLLGRNVADVTVIRRHPGGSDYRAILDPRCASRGEVDRVRTVHTVAGRFQGASAKAILDTRGLVYDLGLAPAAGCRPAPFRHRWYAVRARLDLVRFVVTRAVGMVLRRTRRPLDRS